MAPNKQTPANAGRRQGLGLENHFPAISILSTTTPAPHLQQNFAAIRLRQRLGLPPATALVVAELAGIGGVS